VCDSLNKLRHPHSFGIGSKPWTPSLANGVASFPSSVMLQATADIMLYRLELVNLVVDSAARIGTWQLAYHGADQDETCSHSLCIDQILHEARPIGCRGINSNDSILHQASDDVSSFTDQVVEQGIN
jgi:hypothetical protein